MSKTILKKNMWNISWWPIKLTKHSVRKLLCICSYLYKRGQEKFITDLSNEDFLFSDELST